MSEFCPKGGVALEVASTDLDGAWEAGAVGDIEDRGRLEEPAAVGPVGLVDDLDLGIYAVRPRATLPQTRPSFVPCPRKKLRAGTWW